MSKIKVGDIVEYTIEDEFVIPIPTKENSVFLGWSINNGDNIEKELKVKKGTTGDLYLKAHWKEEKYKIRQQVNSLTLEKSRIATDMKIQKDLDNEEAYDKLNQRRNRRLW